MTAEDRERVQPWLEAWIEARSPRVEQAASMGGPGGWRGWAQLDSIDEIVEEGDVVRVRFTWSEHRESEFTVHSESGDESLVARHQEDVRFDRSGTAVGD